MSRNRPKPSSANNHVYSPHGATSNGIQQPTYSSITTARGSGPQYRSITEDVHAPVTVVTTISAIVESVSARGESSRYSTYHIINAVNAEFIPDIRPLAIDMIALSEQAFARRDFIDTAYSTPYYIKDFQATKPKKNIFGESC